MNFSEFPFLRYLFFLVLGILFYPNLPIQGIYWLLGIILFFSYFSMAVFISLQKGFVGKMILPIMAYAILVWAGWFFAYQNDVLNQSEHLIHEVGYEAYLGIVEDLDETKPKTKANTVAVQGIYKEGKLEKSSGRVLIYHQVADGFRPGQVVLVKGQPKRVPPPQNPKEFDYQKFLSNQQIYFTQFTGKNIWLVDEIPGYRPLHVGVLKLREALKSQIHLHVSDIRAKQIAEALLLGQKKELDPELKAAYVTAGAMHILAVSGLHVGIIYGFFFLLLKPYQLTFHLRVFYLTAVIVLIWAYALLTGLSPSVMRAATMFTLIGLAQMKSRNPSIFNPLALSALLLLMYDPNLLYAVGFQLSYAALTGILLFQPLIVKWWEPKNKFLEYGWQITSVGLAAQLATFPISAYYFHVFPSYFILSNLVAIPGAFLIMSIGIPFLLLSWIPFLGNFLGYLLDLAIQLLNLLIMSIQNLPFSQISSIALKPLEILLYGLFLIFVYVFWEQRNKWSIWGIVVLAIIYGIYQLIEVAVINNRQELYVYSIGSDPIVDFYSGSLQYSYQKGSVSVSDLEYKISPHRMALGSHYQLQLMVSHEEEVVHFWLPNRKVVKMVRDSLYLPPDVKTYQFQFGKWEIVPDPIKVKLENVAYKIDF
ncbi:ComEC/Rec2 family competence protein [Pararhodonellum marinum]|uniref:ComEC/Rec2 family competence protein n=1 Tax=Pararhodonellum marinum TaxID=2755358 RepID=UPI001890B36A|nr:ComEC/Rec2 family competence protein [Pararhodonellum marinum]